MKIEFLILSLYQISSSIAFIGTPRRFHQSRHILHIDQETARMIDEQLWRQNHPDQVEATWRKNNAFVLDQNFPGATVLEGDDFIGMVHDLDDSIINRRQLERDRRLARLDPSAYCADRCIATGNCDVYEDFFQLSPSEVVTFCHDCVLGDGEEPCDVPPHLLEEGFKKLKP